MPIPLEAIFLRSTVEDDPMVHGLAALRDQAERDDHLLLVHLIDIALIEAEHLAETGRLSMQRCARAAG